MTYFGPKVLGNFRKAREEGPKPHKNSEKHKDRPGMSESHLALIRKMPCARCLRVPASEAHHLKSIPGTRGAGLRAPDKFAVPLCRQHHEEIERAGTRNEMSMMAASGVANVHVLASDLWNASGDLPKMVKILLAHRGHK